MVLDLTECNGCALCVDACPEPHGLHLFEEAFDVVGPATPQGARPFTAPHPEPWPGTLVDLPEREPLIVKGTYAAALGAILAGCRHVFGYPITPSTEGAELMARVLPELDGIFVQAVSEVATVNMMYGAGGAGKRCMTFTSSPGFSLMLEGISYMIGAEVPAVFVNIMRGGPGLGNVGPEQADIKLACRGLGHGNTHAIALAPASPQEMLDLTMLSFELAFKYRNPVVVLGDGYLGQMTGKVQLPSQMVRPGIPEWAEQRVEFHRCDDAEVLLVACNTPAQLAKGAIRDLRDKGLRVGLLRPITVWPFPIDGLCSVLDQVKRLVVVEASSGQLEDEMRLALSHAGVHAPPPISHVRRMGGILPSQGEIIEHVLGVQELS